MSKPFYTIQKSNRNGSWENWAFPSLEDLPQVLREERETYPDWTFRVIRSEVVEM